MQLFYIEVCRMSILTQSPIKKTQFHFPCKCINTPISPKVEVISIKILSTHLPTLFLDGVSDEQKLWNFLIGGDQNKKGGPILIQNGQYQC